jgi:hypothetical protein
MFQLSTALGCPRRPVKSLDWSWSVSLFSWVRADTKAAAALVPKAAALVPKAAALVPKPEEDEPKVAAPAKPTHGYRLRPRRAVIYR